MLVAIDHAGGATAGSELHRARVALGTAAESLAAICRDSNAPPTAVADAESRVSDAFAQFGRMMLAAAALRRSRS